MARALITAADCKELPIPQGLVAWWFGTYTSIPAGWEIADGQVSVNDPSYTKPGLCDGRFPKGSNTAGTTGGSAGHMHTVPSHTHTTGGNAQCTDQNFNSGNASPCNRVEPCVHTHSTSSWDGSISAANNLPLHVQAIPIVYTQKGDPSRGLLRVRDFAASALPPRKIIAGWISSSTPSGWSECNGSTVNGVITPNLNGKYLKGIPNTSTNPGSTGGGTNHVHDVTHYHATSDAGNVGTGVNAYGQGGQYWPQPYAHYHPVNSTSLTSGISSNEPEYRTIRYLCFTGHGASSAAHASAWLTASDLVSTLLLPSGAVLAWAFPLTEMPAGWSHCDGGGRPNLLNRYIRHVPDNTTNGGIASGNAVHNHPAPAHTHVLLGSSCTGRDGDIGTGVHCTKDHTHTSGAASYTGSLSGNNLPDYYEVAWLIKN